nr:MAG TPA: hypothetical protein [Caudoviricetes sp.]
MRPKNTRSWNYLRISGAGPYGGNKDNLSGGDFGCLN